MRYLVSILAAALFIAVSLLGASYYFNNIEPSVIPPEEETMLQDKDIFAEIDAETETYENLPPIPDIVSPSPSGAFRVYSSGMPQSSDYQQLTPSQVNREQYEETDDNPIKLVSKEPVSTFSSDVDTTSYAVARRYLKQGNKLPPSNSVRPEEFLNYFDYDYKRPESTNPPFVTTTWLHPTPWNEKTKLMHIGVQGYEVQQEEKPSANIVLLIDRSGSMQHSNKLELAQKAFNLMIDNLSKDDYVSIVAYAANPQIIIGPTKASEKTKLKSLINSLETAGSTGGGPSSCGCLFSSGRKLRP